MLDGSNAESTDDMQVLCSDDKLKELVRCLLRGRSVQVQSDDQAVGLDASGLLCAINRIVKKSKRPDSVIHCLLPALDVFVRDTEVECVESDLIQLLILFMDLCSRDASVIGHVFHKLVLLAQLPSYQMAIAEKFSTLAVDSLLENSLSLVKADRPILESFISVFTSIMQSQIVHDKSFLSKLKVFAAICDLLKEEEAFQLAPCSLQKILSLLVVTADGQLESQQMLLSRNMQKQVADLMMRHVSDESMHQTACSFFVTLSAVPANKQQLVNFPVCSALTGTIKAFRHQCCVLMPALQAVGNLALNGYGSSEIIDTGIHHSVIECLADEKVNVICRYQACSVLVNMTCTNLQDRKRLVEAGAHCPVNSLLQNAKLLCKELLSQACKVLINLTAAAGQSDVASRLIQDGIHCVLIQLMRQPQTIPPCLVFHCCWAILNMSQSNETNVMLIESGAAHCLVNVINHYYQCKKISEKAMAALSALTASEQSRVVFMSTHAHKAIIYLFRSCLILPLWITEKLIRVITVLASCCDRYRRALVLDGAIQPILNYMNRYLCDAQLQMMVCQAVHRISVNGNNKLALIESGVLQHIRQMLQAHRINEEVHRHGLLVIACLSLVEVEAKRLIGEAGCIQDAVVSLVSFSQSANVQTLGFIVLLCLAKNNWNLKQMARLRLTEFMLTALERFPQETDVQNYGSTLLSCLYCYFVERRPGIGRVSCVRSSQSKVNTVRVSQLSGVTYNVCPNCKNGRASEMVIKIGHLNVSVYQKLVDRGWFRRGAIQLFASTSCHSPSCNTAELRVDIRKFEVVRSKMYKRVIKKCERRGVTVRTVQPQFSDEAFHLYSQYQMKRHESENCTASSYHAHLVSTPLIPQEINGIAYGTFHQQYQIDGRLVGVGVIDVLPQALCSVYMFYDVSSEISKLSLGVYSAIMEIQFAQSLNAQGANIHHYYLGSFNPTNKKLLYKANYRPSEVMCPHVSMQWQPYAGSSCSVFGEPSTSTISTSLLPSIARPHSSCPIRRSIACARRKCMSKKSMPTYKDLLFLVEGHLLHGGELLNYYVVHPKCVDSLIHTLELLIKIMGPELARQLEIELEVIEPKKVTTQ